MRPDQIEVGKTYEGKSGRRAKFKSDQIGAWIIIENQEGEIAKVKREDFAAWAIRAVRQAHHRKAG